MNAKAALARSVAGAAGLVLAASALGADCQGNIVQDPAFRDWCGASLCSWQTDSGRIQRVPTWDANDFGVAFLDPGTQISQVTEEDQATCILFTSVGDIDPTAEMTLSVDFDNDGTVDYTAPLGAVTWNKVQTEISAPAAYHGITFYVKKSGTGTAILAEMAITSTTGCTAPPVSLPPLRMGEGCSSTTQCAEGLVCPEPVDGGFRLCGQCSPESPCGDGGVACAQRGLLLPSQCGPGERLGASGAPCLADDDCASEACDGATLTALFGDGGPGACDLDAVDAPACALETALGGTCR